MKNFKPIAEFIGILVFVVLIAISLMGGFLYVFFPRPDLVGDDSIITSCREIGGEPMWVKWKNGCNDDGDDRGCYIEMCIIKN